MVVAVVSDIHSNEHALEAVLEAIEATGPERIVCLGDVVGYAARPAECLARVRDVCDVVVQGNHDHAVTVGQPISFNSEARRGVAYSQDQLDDEQIAYLGDLEPMIREPGLCLCHGSPRRPLREYVTRGTPKSDLRHIAEAGERPIVLMGHTHVPMDLTVGGTRLLNPGSVGQPRDGDPRASFGLLDVEEGTFEVERVGYDIDAAIEAIEEAGLPAFTGERLREGM